jgi:hypothetical protein
LFFPEVVDELLLRSIFGVEIGIGRRKRRFG